MKIDQNTLFNNSHRLEIPHFTKQESIVESPICYPPTGTNAIEWWQFFYDSFFHALKNHQNFPVFRSGHGEYAFVLGFKNQHKKLKKIIRYYLSRIYRIIYFQSTFYSGTPSYGYETYKLWHLPSLRNDFKKYIKWISQNGILSMYFSDRDAFSLEKQKAYLKWLNNNNIELTIKNYSHIYYVYGLFNGPETESIFADRKLLIVSSDQPKRTHMLRKNLFEYKVTDLRIIPISRNHSLQDNIQIPKDYSPDLCLIGAGVGAAKMIYQLRKLKCPVIDVGYVLDTLAYPEMRKNRIYCVNDESWEKIFPNNDPPYKEKFSEKSLIESISNKST